MQVIHCSIWFSIAAFLTGGLMAQEGDSSGLPDQPMLRIESGMHSATIRKIAVDGAGKLLATAADDKTVRLWNLHDGELVRTWRLPSDDGDVGKAFAVALLRMVASWRRAVIRGARRGASRSSTFTPPVPVISSPRCVRSRVRSSTWPFLRMAAIWRPVIREGMGCGSTGWIWIMGGFISRLRTLDTGTRAAIGRIGRPRGTRCGWRRLVWMARSGSIRCRPPQAVSQVRSALWCRSFPCNCPTEDSPSPAPSTPTGNACLGLQRSSPGDRSPVERFERGV